jgi:hypothetical protein
MSIDTVKQAIQSITQANADIKKLVTRDSSIALHAGKFTWQELTERSFNAPAIFISHLGFQTANENVAAEFDQPSKVMDVRFSVGIVAKHVRGTEARNALGNAITELFALQLYNQNWGLDTVGKPDRVKAQGLYHPQAEADGQSMWLITWYQPVQLSSFDWNAADMFMGYDADHFAENDDVETDTPIAQSQQDY